VKTPFGEGILISVRKDGVCAIDLGWKLASGHPARAFISREQLVALNGGSALPRKFVLSNSRGMMVSLTNVGAGFLEVKLPLNRGNRPVSDTKSKPSIGSGDDAKNERNYVDVVCAYDNANDILTRKPNFSTLVGRYANRIGGARFSVGGTEYKVESNDGGGVHHLHGGSQGFCRRIFELVGIGDTEGGGGAFVELKYVSADGEMGYPGSLSVGCRYTLTAQNELKIDLEAT
jgi:galactose mutarotase-like enzyme